MTIGPLTPVTEPTLTKAVAWLHDCADGLWTASKRAGLYAPLLIEERRQMRTALHQERERSAKLQEQRDRATQQVTDTCGTRYTIAERAADLIAAHEDDPSVYGYRRRMAPFVAALNEALRAGR